MKKNKQKIIKLQRAALLAVFSVIISFSPLAAPKTHAWDAMPAAIYQVIKTELLRHIRGIQLAMLKQQAIKTLNGQVSKAVGGGGGKNAMFITNWEDYLVKQPKKNSDLYINDYLTKITSGKGSSTGYKSEGFSSGSLSSLLGSGTGGYSNQLVQAAKAQTSAKKDPQMTYEGDPAQMFSQNNFKLLSLYLSGINNPWAFTANAQAEYQKKKTQEEQMAKTRSVANQAFISAGENKNGKGTITTPGIIIKEKVAGTQDIGNKTIASATNPEEVITAVVSQMINQLMKQGISQIGDSKITSALGSVLSQTLQTSGPGQVYKSSVLSNQSSISSSVAKTRPNDDGLR